MTSRTMRTTVGDSPIAYIGGGPYAVWPLGWDDVLEIHIYNAEIEEVSPVQGGIFYF
jgi:hypothetical protein